MAGFSVVKRGLDAERDGRGLPSNTVTTTSLQPSKLAQVEPLTVPYTLYVDNLQGSDTNNIGNSPGQAYQTIAKAVNRIHQAQRGGEIVLMGVSPGNYDISAPLSMTYPVFIRAVTPSAVTIRRTFTTPNSRSVWDAVTTVSGTSVSSATAAFAPADINRIVSIYGAGLQGGTYYDFISARTSTTATFANGTTTIARSPATEGCGAIKMSVVGDWNRVVTDASMTAGSNVITSVTAAWTSADLGTEVVIASAGPAHQALRGAISVVSGNTATITSVATFTVSSARCAIGANFGNMLAWWGPRGGQSGLRFVILRDDSVGANSIGAAIAIIAPDGGAGSQINPADFAFEVGTITNSDPAGAWEHDMDCDGSWNQSAAGPGLRRAAFHGFKFFGARAPGETVRLISTTHFSFTGNGIVGAAPATLVPQGYRLLDPQKTAAFQYSSSENFFVNCEGIAAYYYAEGQKASYVGGSLATGTVLAGRRAIELGPTADRNLVITNNNTIFTGVNADEYDAGTNNLIETAVGRLRNARALEQTYGGPVVTGGNAGIESIPRRLFTNNTQTVGSSGVLVLMSIFMQGGTPISKMQYLASGSLAWGSGWTAPHFIYGLYDPSGNLYAQSNDTGGTQVFNGSFNNNVLAVTKDGSGVTISSARVPLTGLNWLALLINSGTGGSGFTYPTFAGLNGGLAGISPALCGTSGSGLVALPTTVAIPPATPYAGCLYCVVAT